jgi:hypothetical protein
VGYLEMLASGTLVITHAELMDHHVQVKLLTYLKLGWFHRVLGQSSVKAATRIVLLANGEEAAVLDRLIPELRDELKPNLLTLPTLASRLKDIPLLAEHFLKLHARKAGKRIGSISREASDKLVSYAWPGNLTELENVIQRAAIVATEDALIPGDLIFVTAPEKDIHKLNLLRTEEIRGWLRKSWVFAGGTWIAMAFVGVIALLTLYGGTRLQTHPLFHAETNPGMLVTWLVWFPLMPFVAALIGRVWCGFCPIAGFGDLIARLGRLNLPVPKFMKSMGFWCLVATFVVVEYTEGALELDASAMSTGVFLMALLLLAATMTVLFERRAFCKYLCPLAAWLGAYSAMSPLEIRGNKKVCQTQCGEHTCFKGTDKIPGCPMFLYPASMSSNTDCLLCTNCVRSCENRGVQLNLRPPLQELWRNSQPMIAVSVLAIVIVAIMFNHQLSHVTVWKQLKATLPFTPGMRRFVVWSLVVLANLVGLGVASVLSAAASQEKTSENMARYGIAFIPLAFAGHGAIMVVELLGDGVSMLWLYAKAFWGWLVRGQPITFDPAAVTSFVNPAVLTFMKFILVMGGVMGTMVALIMIARQGGRQGAFARALPHLLLLAVLGSLYLWVFTASTAAPAATAGTVGSLVLPR